MLTSVASSPRREALPAANSQAEVDKRAALGQILWAGPLAAVSARTVLMILAQASVAGLYLLRHHPSPWRAAAPWWSVYGTLVDIGCLALMAGFLRREGIRLRDLIGGIRLRGGRDIFVGIGWLALALPFFTLAAQLASKWVYGSTQPYLYPGLLAGRSLPLWAVIYSLSLWWIVWSPTEEMTYQAYALPRIQALSGRAWVAIVVVAFWWALQHSFIPLILDWRYVAWRFLAFLPGVTVFTLIYIRTRRLLPLIVAHWSLDAFAIVITLNF
jgi:membrane protease YdiL (CAAX protease family)